LSVLAGNALRARNVSVLLLLRFVYSTDISVLFRFTRHHLSSLIKTSHSQAIKFSSVSSRRKLHIGSSILPLIVTYDCCFPAGHLPPELKRVRRARVTTASCPCNAEGATWQARRCNAIAALHLLRFICIPAGLHAIFRVPRLSPFASPTCNTSWPSRRKGIAAEIRCR